MIGQLEALGKNPETIMPDISNSSGAATEEMMQPCLIYLHGISLLPFRTTHICRVSFCPRTSRCTPVPARSRPVFAPALQTVPATVLTLLNLSGPGRRRRQPIMGVHADCECPGLQQLFRFCLSLRFHGLCN